MLVPMDDPKDDSNHSDTSRQEPNPNQIMVELFPELMEQVEYRAKELNISKENALMELLLIGLERLGRLPKPKDLRRAFVITPEVAHYLRVGGSVYEVMATSPHDAVMEQLDKWKAKNVAVGKGRFDRRGCWIFTVVGLSLEGQTVETIEVYERYPKL